VRGVDRVRRFELGSREINDRKMDMGRIDHVVEPGTTEIWEVENTTGTPHSFHTHDIRFRILESGGEPPPPTSRDPRTPSTCRPARPCGC
jgi:suppressor of ftsI